MAICLFTKQNLGLFLLGGIVFTRFCFHIFISGGLKLKRFRGDFGCFLGFGIGLFFLVDYYWGSSDIRSFYQLFLGVASAAKGGALKVALRTVPRFVIFNTPDNGQLPNLNIAITAVSYPLVFWWISTARGDQGNFGEKFTKYCLIYFVGVSLVTLVPSQSIHHLLNRSSTGLKALGFYPFGCYYLISLLVFLGSGVLFRRKFSTQSGKFYLNRENYPQFCLVSLSVFVFCGANAARVDWIRFSVLSLIPLLNIIIDEFGFRAVRIIQIATFGVVLNNTLLSDSVPTFVDLAGFHDDSAYSGLAAPMEVTKNVTSSCQCIQELQYSGKVAQIINPYSYVCEVGAGVVNLTYHNYDQYSLYSEAKILQSWEENPPEFVLLRYFSELRGAGFFNQKIFQQWLEKGYTELKSCPGANIWKRTKG